MPQCVYMYMITDNKYTFAARHVLLSRKTIGFLLLKFALDSAVAGERVLSESSESELRR